MWIVVSVILLVLLAVILLPLGAEITSVAGDRRWKMILAGLHIPVPKSVILKLTSRLASEKDGAGAHADKQSWMDLARNFYRLRNKGTSFLDAVRVDDLRAALLLAIRIIRAIRIRVYRLHVLIATPDPALTGVAYGISCAVIGMLPASWPVSVDADWRSEVPEFTYRVEASVLPVRIIAALMGNWLRKIGRRVS